MKWLPLITQTHETAKNNNSYGASSIEEILIDLEETIAAGAGHDVPDEVMKDLNQRISELKKRYENQQQSSNGADDDDAQKMDAVEDQIEDIDRKLGSKRNPKRGNL